MALVDCPRPMQNTKEQSPSLDSCLLRLLSVHLSSAPTERTRLLPGLPTPLNNASFKLDILQPT